MRKIFLIIIITTLLVASVGFVSGDESLGLISNPDACDADTNNDGNVNLLDLVDIRNEMNKEVTKDNILLDVNKDGKINLLDLVAVRDNLGKICSKKPQANGNCDSQSRESAEGPGGTYCTYEDYEECYNYKTKSTAYAYYGGGLVESGTDYCSDSHTLQEAWLNCRYCFIVCDPSKDEVNFKTKDCNDYDDSGTWEYYCTDTEVKRKKYVWDYGCSDGACKIVYKGWREELVSKNGDDDYCDDRQSYGCTLCTHGQYDCDSDSECAGNLECMGPIGGALDGCCSSGETWDTSTMTCKAPCQCSSGACCDGCYYRPSSYVCNSHVANSDQYKCEGTCLSDDILKRYQQQYCSGSLSSCTGTKDWVEYTYKSCDSSQFCSGSTSWETTIPTCKTAQCTSGKCCDATCGVYNYRPTSYACTSLLWYGCPWGNGPGSDVGKKTVTRYCNGYSSSCNGEVIHGSWSVKQDCSLTQHCTGSEGPDELWCTTILCIDDCNSGQTRCSGNVKQTCGNYDADSCLEWPSSTSGSGNENCGKTGYCSSNSCQTCPSGKANCNQNPSDICEVNLLSDNNNCGCCGCICSSGLTCQGGLCKSPPCSCASWVNGACGGGGCASTQRQQTRTCTPSGCQAESQCVSDASCQTQQCSGTSSSCGIWPNCENCNNKDGCYSDYNRDYSCSSNIAGCTYTSDDCSDCSCTCGNYGKSSETGFCSDGKDNDCDGKIDFADTECAFCSKNSDCGTDSWVESAFCSSGDVYQKWRIWTCKNPGTTSSFCSYSDSDKKKEDCGTFECLNGVCQNTMRINLKAGNNIFSLPRNKQVSFNQLITNCNVVSGSGRVDLAYYAPADNTDYSNYKFITLNDVLYPGQGYYINVKNDCYIDIEGGKILSSELGFWESGFSGNGLRTGWNLIGAPSIATTFSPGTCQLYDGIGILKYAYNVASCSQVSGWNGAYQDCQIQNGINRCKCSVNFFEPGLGYWIRTKNYCKLA